MVTKAELILDLKQILAQYISLIEALTQYVSSYYLMLIVQIKLMFAFIMSGQGKVLKDHPPIKFLVSISGSKFRDPSICDIAYKDPIKVKSVHFIGEKDWLKLPSEELAAAFDNPLILRHPQGHTVPRLGWYLLPLFFFFHLNQSITYSMNGTRVR